MKVRPYSEYDEQARAKMFVMSPQKETRERYVSLEFEIKGQLSHHIAMKSATAMSSKGTT